MRRLASVFSSKRDKSDAASSNGSSVSSSQFSLRKSLKRGDTLRVTQLSKPNNSVPALSTQLTLSEPSQSSASSSGSASLRTPDDEPAHFEPPPGNRASLMTWFGKRSGTVKRASKAEIPSSWKRPPPPVLLQPPEARHPTQQLVDDDTDESASEPEYDDDASAHGRTASNVSVNAHNTPAAAKRVLESRLDNDLLPRISLPPFLSLPSVPLFPRSCNHPRELSPQASLRSDLLKRRLLRKLRDREAKLTAFEEASILPLASRSSAARSSPHVPPLDDVALPKRSKVGSFSDGLRRWVTRPCFEDRYCVWLPVDGEIACFGVSGTRFGVQELEYSEGLEAMVDFNSVPSPVVHPSPTISVNAIPDVLPSPSPPPSATPSSSMTNANNVNVPASRHSFPPPPLPSPLRMEHHLSDDQSLSRGSQRSREPPKLEMPFPSTKPVPLPVATPVKRGVHFAEDDKEDGIPLGYVMRQKQNRERKARFLREQNERRAFETERAKLEAERRQRDKERQEWERERRAWEAEKRTVEEEKKRRLYADEVTAARMRREAQNAGHKGSKAMLAETPSYTALRDGPNVTIDAKKRYSRPAYDSSRRQVSDPAPAHTGSSLPSSSDSPGSSRSPSLSGTSQSPNRSSVALVAPKPGSRPSSLHSNHSFTTEATRERKASAGNRNSVASGSVPTRRSTTGKLPLNTQFWSGSQPNLLVPPMPPMPTAMQMQMQPYGFDMPLLPPTAPFMLNQYRQRSHHSPSPETPRTPRSGHSASPARHGSPRSGSSSRAGSTERGGASKGHKSTPSGGSSSRGRPQQQSSGGQSSSQRTSLPHSNSFPERGRKAVPVSQSRQSLGQNQVYSEPNPWTAMPTQTGRLPTGMHHGVDYTRVQPSRRQTTIS